MDKKTNHRALNLIMREVKQDWKKPYFGAVPYIQALSQMDNVSQNYGEDSAKKLVLYFLANANTWRGETARRVKAELKSMVGVK